jgi:hypothetical protein
LEQEASDRNQFTFERVNIMKQHRLLFFLFALLVLPTKGLQSQNDSIAPIATEPLVRGVYMSHGEFISNQPSITDEFYLQKKARKKGLWVGSFNLIPRLSENDKKVKRAWGFCDGERSYVYHEKEYFPITVDGQKVLFYGYGLSEESESEKAMAVVAAIMGGIAGAIIYELSHDVVSKRAAKAQHKLFYIDQFTGTIIPDYLLMKAGYDFLIPNLSFTYIALKRKQ